MTRYPDSERSNDGHSRGRPQSQTLVHLRRRPARASTREAVLVTASPMAETHPGNVWDVWGLVSANSVNKSSLIFPAGCASHIYRHRTTGSGIAEMRRRRPWFNNSSSYNRNFVFDSAPALPAFTCGISRNITAKVAQRSLYPTLRSFLRQEGSRGEAGWGWILSLLLPRSGWVSIPIWNVLSITNT